MVSAGRAVAGFDSATAMVRILGAALHGRDAPLVAQGPARLEPLFDRFVTGVERLPERVVQEIYRRMGWLDAVNASSLRQVRSDQLADWVVRHYPSRRFPVVFVGSSNGAVVHLAAALGVPWLPQTLLIAVRRGTLDPDDPTTDLRAMAPAGRSLLAHNPDLTLHHMHDPCQDRLMIARMTYFRVKFLRLPAPYLAFLDRCLTPGGTIILVDCARQWPTTTVGDRQVFQFGAVGGLSADEFLRGSARVTEFLRRQGTHRDRWLPPAADGDSPEAEWGFAEPLADDVATAAARREWTVQRLRVGMSDDASPLVAELLRDWYAAHGLPTGRLVVSSFLLMDPVLTMRTGSVPYWALFGTRPSLDRLAGYLSQAAPYDEILLTVFPHGVKSAGLPDIGEWQAAAGHARHGGRLLGVDPRRYPGTSGCFPASTES